MKIDYLKLANETLKLEADAIIKMSGRLNTQFEKAVEIILNTQGRVVVVGMGKSGIIGQKLAATMASTGTSAFFVHPGEAFHGDLGMIKPIDVALLISNSGETEEIIRIIPFLKEQNNQIIAMTGNIQSTLAKHVHAVLDISVSREACSNNLAPTSSTTCTLAMGDALAMVLQSEKNFQPEDFARFHPGGSLGRRLLTRVSDVMKTQVPSCPPNAVFKEIVYSINRGCIGLTLVIENDELCGIITDGDLRRAFDKFENIGQVRAADIMSLSPKSIAENIRLADAETYMRSEKINSLIVMREEKVVGILNIHDI